MSQMRKKSFSFQEEEMEWINPLLVEWSKENEGKSQSHLVLQLLREHRDRRPTPRESLDRAADLMREKFSEYSSRSTDALNGFMVKSKDFLQTMQSEMKTWGGRLMDQLRKTETDLLAKLQDIKAEMSRPKKDPDEEG